MAVVSVSETIIVTMMAEARELCGVWAMCLRSVNLLRGLWDSVDCRYFTTVRKSCPCVFVTLENRGLVVHIVKAETKYVLSNLYVRECWS